MMKRPPHNAELELGLALDIERVCAEPVLIDELLDLDDKEILELGCGTAEKTRALATSGEGRRILALEVDEIQHALNLEIDDLPNVRFERGGAEQIPAADRSFDIVFLFKSLHHVPVGSMDRALAEITRVLRPGGLAYISEPLFRGEFNEIMRIFHDESRVRREAFLAISRAVRAGRVELVSQSFIRAPLRFSNFAEFEKLVIRVTHSSHVLTEEVEARVRSKFASFENKDGVLFEQPIRVDLLRRPAGA
ncbi:MAG: class I SAM-dependent methyltransferase [Planctomycetota bacterium]